MSSVLDLVVQVLGGGKGGSIQEKVTGGVHDRLTFYQSVGTCTENVTQPTISSDAD